ncbi:SBBP repeat-containing protein [Promethearchaeum syntrophicum]|uniref:SBBP repeat-containing protein n=1 Tax=Promethearchaeum syntrophicum TaxID=2594042 RepID=A0A5B9D6T3_9ARCH|nr:SBBP repeat-containing protein [Candidatus Prometheoarchaeum syntrophicum]QEE14507.1 Beta-propeller repeat protein [Candidatus Prometheoarchaeum syntrophicum]
MKKKIKNLRRKKVSNIMLICIVYILFLSFLIVGSSNFYYKQDRINTPIKGYQDSTIYPIEQLWNITWGGNGRDRASDMELDSSNNIYLSGFTNSSGAGDLDMVLVKYNSLGEQQWNTTWGGSDMDSGLAVALDSSEDIYLGGMTRSFGHGSMDFDMVLVKYNNLGEQQWNTTWGGINSDICSNIAVDSSNNIYLTGRTWNFGAEGGDMVIVKYNYLGEQQWNTTWGGNLSDTGNEIIVDPFDNIYVVGWTTSFGAGNNDIVLVKYNSLGEQQWNTTWGGANHDLGYSIGLDSLNNVYITGAANFPLFSPFNPMISDIVLIKYNSSGFQQWNATWGGSGEDSGQGIAINPSDNIYLAGKTNSSGAREMDMVFVKYDNLGEQQWNATWGGSEIDVAMEIKFDPSNNIYITGYTDSFGSGGSDMVLIKYKLLELTVTNPTSSSTWQINNNYTITWTSIGSISNVIIELYENDVFVMEIAATASNNGYFSWAIPSSLENSTLYQIKISDSVNPAIYDYSNYFEIIKKDSVLISGYNLVLLIGVIGLISAIIIKKQNKSIVNIVKIKNL